jgi:FMN phosphatase YigB (HAD superfamily)
MVTSVENPVLVFDWGNTVMKVFPQYSGPMTSWPEVSEVNGIVEALEGLKERYTMVVATNASDSNSEQVWNALRKVGLAEYFKAVFTSHELGSRKPDTLFFRRLESVLARPSHAMVMIGDDYATDVLGALNAGWRTVWFNPTAHVAAGAIPLHDCEVTHLQHLPAVLQEPALPGYATCLAWLEAAGTPFNIFTHVHLVAAVAYTLAVWLRGRGEDLNPILVHRGGLLHDLQKIEDIRHRNRQSSSGSEDASPWPDHARMARDRLLERSQPELAEIADRHMPVSQSRPNRSPQTWEQKLVHFADKMAHDNHLVPVEERLEALKARYPEFSGELTESKPFLLDLQADICTRLEIQTGELFSRLHQALYRSD